ncbi:phage shock protein PspA [Hirschia maritima]|uniref:phage shock protein PspA n=1 Tax=Hirschia maritima TaxID=1121961 RepID=UPI000376075E|nr:phage shock protein PspA [Hirschia maritima]
MGIFSRFSDIINSNLNAMLDKAEDPEKIARLIIQEMEDTLIEVRTAAARTMADKKELKREIREFETARDDWASKAELAIEKDREDLARGALSAKQRAEREIEGRKSALAAVDDAAAKRQDDLGKLQAKLEEAKTKHRALMVRREAAEERIKVRSRIDDSKVEDALHRYAAVERKVDELEAYADTYDMKSKTLEDEFADLEAEESVEKELKALKARKKSGSEE